jgi:hypothetical protein
MRQGRGGRLGDKEDNTNEKWSFLQISILFVTELLLYGYPPLPTFLPCPPCLSFLVRKKPTLVSLGDRGAKYTLMKLNKRSLYKVADALGRDRQVL